MREYPFLRGDALFKRRLATRSVGLQGLAVGAPALTAGIRVAQAANRRLTSLTPSGIAVVSGK